RPTERVWTGRPGNLCRPLRDREGGPRAVRRRADRSGRRGAGTLLRHLGRAAPQAPGRPCHRRSGSSESVWLATSPRKRPPTAPRLWRGSAGRCLRKAPNLRFGSERPPLNSRGASTGRQGYQVCWSSVVSASLRSSQAGFEGKSSLVRMAMVVVVGQAGGVKAAGARAPPDRGTGRSLVAGARRRLRG